MDPKFTLDEEDYAFLEGILGKFEGERVTMESVSWTSPGPLCANYSSQVANLELKLHLESGSKVARRVFVKKIPRNPSLVRFLEERKSFQTEIKVYSYIIIEMEQLMTEHNDQSEKLWCNFLGHRDHNFLVLEDLKNSGFKASGRVCRPNEAVKVLRALGKLHALSFLLLQQCPVSRDSLPVYFHAANTPSNTAFLQRGLLAMAENIQKTWSEEWQEAAERLKQLSENVGEKLSEFWKESSGKMVVLNHGDCWGSNIMFKYASDVDAPVGIRFVDWQGSHFSSYGWDLKFFLTTSLKPKEREEHLDDLLSQYRDSFVTQLEFYNYGIKLPLSLQDIKNELNRLSVYGVVVSCSVLPALMASSSEMSEVQDILLGPSGVNEPLKNVYTKDDLAETVRNDVSVCLKMGLI